MATNYPTSLDTFTNPTKHHNLNDGGIPHFQQHANENDAIEAVQLKLGIDDSEDTSSIDYKVNALLGTGTKKPASANFRQKSDGVAQLKNDDDGLWYKIGVKNIEGKAVLYLADAGE